MKPFKRYLRHIVAGLCFAGPLLAAAQSLPSTSPERVGLSTERLQMLTEVLKAGVAANKIPGAVLLFARGGKVAWFEPIGRLDPSAGTPMPRDGIFRIYSMSKPITTVAAMMLVEDGRMKLDDPISMYLPEFAKMTVGVEKPGTDGKPMLETVPARRPITVHDLMRHTSGLTYGFFGPGLVKQAYNAADLFANDPSNAEFSQRLAKLPLAYQRGTTWDYGHSTDILGRVVEVVSGQTASATSVRARWPSWHRTIPTPGPASCPARSTCRVPATASAWALRFVAATEKRPTRPPPASSNGAVPAAPACGWTPRTRCSWCSCCSRPSTARTTAAWCATWPTPPWSSSLEAVSTRSMR
jgi:hypothetical protein